LPTVNEQMTVWLAQGFGCILLRCICSLLVLPLPLLWTNLIFNP